MATEQFQVELAQPSIEQAYAITDILKQFAQLEYPGEPQDRIETGVHVALQNQRLTRCQYHMVRLGPAVHEVIGVARTSRLWSDWSARWTLLIDDVFVRPEFRRRGIARLIFDHIEAHARAEDTRVLELAVHEANEAAQALYRSLGFVPSAMHGMTKVLT